MKSNCSNLLGMRNLQEEVKKLFWPFTVWINCSDDIKKFANSRPSASNLTRSLEHFFLTVGQNNSGNKIPFWAGSTKGTRWRSSIQIFIDDQNPQEKIHPPFHNDRYQDQAWDPTFVLHMVGITVGIKWCKNISPITWRIYNVLIN